MDEAVQRKMSKLDEKSEQLDKIFRCLMSMSSEAPTSQNFEEDSELVSQHLSAVFKTKITYRIINISAKSVSKI